MFSTNMTMTTTASLMLIPRSLTKRLTRAPIVVIHLKAILNLFRVKFVTANALLIIRINLDWVATKTECAKGGLTHNVQIWYNGFHLRIERNNMTTDPKILERLRKLLSMAADGSSPQEAAIAAKQARTLMDKHQLSKSDLVESDEFGIVSVGAARRFTPVWEQGIAILVAQYNDCVVSLENINSFRVLTFKGLEADVVAAKLMFTYLTDNGKRLCKNYMAGHYNARTGTQFKGAYVRALNEKFKELIVERTKLTTNTALMVVKKDLVKSKFGETKTAFHRTKEYYDEKARAAVAAGYMAGKVTNINVEID